MAELIAKFAHSSPNLSADSKDQGCAYKALLAVFFFFLNFEIQGLYGSFKIETAKTYSFETDQIIFSVPNNLPKSGATLCGQGLDEFFAKFCGNLITRPKLNSEKGREVRVRETALSLSKTWDRFCVGVLIQLLSTLK